jgi:hypothetical protein
LWIVSILRCQNEVSAITFEAGRANLKQWYATDKKKQQCEKDWPKDHQPLSTFQYRCRSHKNTPPKENLRMTFNKV